MLKLVKGATKPKAAAPKAKYIEPILATTYEEGKDFSTTMEALGKVLTRSPAWTSMYKALIVLHIMIREGCEEVTLKYLSKHQRMLEPDEATARQAVGLLRYSRYLAVRSAQFKETKVDYVRYKTRQGHGRLYGLTVDKGLLRESESVIIQLEALLKCHFEEHDVDNDVVLMAFRLLSHDLLSLFQVLNEGVINLLEHYFELSKIDAENALDVYRGFTRLTNKVIAFLRVAKNLEYQTKFHVPNIKHAPTSLVSSLEMYLNDPDFETNRRQYLAEKAAKPRSRGDRDEARSELEQQPTAGQRDLNAKMYGSQTSPQLQARQPSFTLSQQMQQPVQQPPQQPVQSMPQQVAPQMAQSQPQHQPARRSFDLLDFGTSSQPSQPQPAAAQPPQASYNPFYSQVQQDVLAQAHAAQIQLEQSQAQMQMQQMQYQQQQLQQSQQLHAQLTGGWDLSPPQAQPQVQPQVQPPQAQPPAQQTIMPIQTTGNAQSAYYNPFKRASVSTNPFAQDQMGGMSGGGQPAYVQQMAPQMTAQPTGTNPFRNSVQ